MPPIGLPEVILGLAVIGLFVLALRTFRRAKQRKP